MKFYIVKNSDGTQKIIAEKVEAGLKPDPDHQELMLDNNFFIQLPSQILTKRLNNKHNTELEESAKKGRSYNIVTTYITKHRNKIRTDLHSFQNHLDVIPYLFRLKTIHVEKHKITGWEEIQCPTIESKEDGNGYEEVIVKRNIIPGAAYETVLKAFTDNNLFQSNATLIGYSTFGNRDAMIFVAQDKETAMAMLSTLEIYDGTAMRQHTGTTWFYTHKIASFLEYIIDLLAKEKRLSEMKLLSATGQLLQPTVFLSSFTKNVSDILTTFDLNIGGKSKKTLIDIINAYTDERQVSVCDFIQTNTIPNELNLETYYISTDKAYLRTGLCGIAFVSTSPEGKLLRTESLEFLLQQEIMVRDLQELTFENRATVLAEITLHINTLYIPDINENIEQLYILSPQGLYFVSDREKAISAANLINTSAENITKLSDLLNPEPLVKTLLPEEQETIKQLTDFERPNKDNIYFIDRTKRIFIPIPNLTSKKITEFDSYMKVSIFSAVDRILFHDELVWITERLSHDYNCDEEMFQIMALIDKDYKSRQCQVMTVNSIPTQENLPNFYLIAEKAYLRVANEIYYVNISEKICIHFEVTPELLKEFDSQIQTPALNEPPHKISYNQFIWIKNNLSHDFQNDLTLIDTKMSKATHEDKVEPAKANHHDLEKDARKIIAFTRLKNTGKISAILSGYNSTEKQKLETMVKQINTSTPDLFGRSRIDFTKIIHEKPDIEDGDNKRKKLGR